MGDRTTIKTLRERLERLNDRLGTSFELYTWSNGKRRVYKILDENGKEITVRGAYAGELDYFIDGMIALDRLE